MAVCNRPDYADLPPSQIVPRLADRGLYPASEASFYRILKAGDQLHHRGRAQARQRFRLLITLQAQAVNEVWTWDISYLPTNVRGRFFYLYPIMGIFSRKIIGWEVHEQEYGEAAAALVQCAVLSEHCWRKPLVLHADNGSPMKSQTLQAKLYELGITPSHSRPGSAMTTRIRKCCF